VMKVGSEALHSVELIPACLRLSALKKSLNKTFPTTHTRTYTHLRHTHNTHASFAWGAIIPALPYHLPRCSRQGTAVCHPHACSHLVVWLLWADRVWDFEISNNLLCETEKKQWQYGGLSRVAGCDVRRFGCVRRTLQRQSHDLYLLWRARCNCTLSGRGLLSNAHSCGSSFHGKQDLSIAFHTLRFARPSGVCAPPFAHVMSVPSSILQWWP
jgi:hypothetical protein